MKTATVTTLPEHGYSTGDTIAITSFDDRWWNRLWRWLTGKPYEPVVSSHKITKVTHSTLENGFTDGDEKIEGFTAKCKCGSVNVSVEYEFNYYGGMTGWDQSLEVVCRDCGHKHSLST